MVNDKNQYIQVGIVSFVAKSGCSAGLPSGYTRVSAYTSWIAQQTGIKI